MKAQLYKMTLYVCDLENNLSLDEIKTLIRQDALDGVSVNCACHFANEQMGAQVEWDDDIDLNEYGCPTSAWDKYYTQQKKPITNADRIRSMSDEELADKLHQLYLIFSDEGYFDFGKLFCDGNAGCIGADGEVTCNDESRKACIIRWLQQPAEE